MLKIVNASVQGDISSLTTLSYSYQDSLRSRWFEAAIFTPEDHDTFQVELLFEFYELPYLKIEGDCSVYGIITRVL